MFYFTDSFDFSRTGYQLRRRVKRWISEYPEDKILVYTHPEEIKEARMSKEVNTNRGYYRRDKNIYSSNSFSDGSNSRSYTRDDLSGPVYPTFTEDVDMRQLNYTTTNYDSTWSSNTREARLAPMNIPNTYPTNNNNIGATNVLDKGQYNYGKPNGIQGPASTSKVERSTYADSFVTYNINNQDPTLQQLVMEKDTVSDIVNPMQNTEPDSKIFSGESMWQINEKNASVKVIHAVERKGRPQNADDPRFSLFPKDPTFNVKIISGGVRISQQVIKISYRKSLKKTIVYTIGRKGGSCKQALANSKQRRALWWIAQGKTIEEALLLCLRPYHEIYEEILEKKYSWGTPIMITNLLEQINREGVYNPFIGGPQANDSEMSDDSADEATEQFIMSEDESNQGYSCPSTYNELDMKVQQNYDQNSNNSKLGSLPTQNNIQNFSSTRAQQDSGNSSSQKASYDPKSHLLSHLADRSRPLPVKSEPASDFTLVRTDNPYTKVNTKFKTVKLKKGIRGAALKRYHYWINIGKTPEVAKALCVLKMNQIPLYHQIKGTFGTLKSHVKRNQKQARFHGTLSVTETGSASIVDKTGYCDNTNHFPENVNMENPQEESEPFIPENTEHGLENSYTSKSYVNEIEQYFKSLKYGGRRHNRIFHPETINKYRWWRHVGRTIKEAQKMCQSPFQHYPKEYEEGVKIIDFETYINSANLNIAEEIQKCPTDFSGHKKILYNQWINLGKTSKEAIDLSLQCFKQEQRNNNLTQSSQKKNNCYSSSSVSKIPTILIKPTIGVFTKDTDDDDDDVAHTGDFKNNIHTYSKRIEDEEDTKKQVEPATQLTHAELINEEARNIICQKSMVISKFLNHIPSYKKERHVDSNTYEEFKSNVTDLSQNLRREEISNKQMLGQNATETDAMAEINFPKNIGAQEGYNLPIKQHRVVPTVPSNVKGSEQGEFKVCIKANKVDMNIDDFNAIKNSLNQCIADEDGIKIKSFNRRSNRVIITCLNEQTRDWLDKQISTLVPWDNAVLEIIDEDEVPLNILARFFVSFDTEAECSSVTSEQFMQQLHEKNPDVGCDRWMVRKVETLPDRIGFYVIACIDKKSNDVLMSKYHRLEWFDKRCIKVSVSSTKKKQNKFESGVRAVLFVPKVPQCRLHSPQQYLLNQLQKLNPTVGCDRWTIIQKRIKPDGAALLVRLNNASKHTVENLKKLYWYQSQTIVITIVPIYVDISLPIDNESSYLRVIPQNQIEKSLINKLHFFNPSFGCLKWVVVQLQDKVDEWHLTFKINEQCHHRLINNEYKLYWFGRWLETKLGTVPELEMFMSKNNKQSKEPVTSYQPNENVSKKNVKQIASGSLLSPQLTVNKESKLSNRKLQPSMLWTNPENRLDFTLFSSSRQDRTAGRSYTERESYHYERHNRVGSDCNEAHQLSPALETALPEMPEYARPPDGHGQGNLDLIGFTQNEDVVQERYSHGIRQYDADRDTGSENRYRLESNRDAYYSNSEHGNIENLDYNNGVCKQNYYNNENRLNDEERGYTRYPNSDHIVNPDRRNEDEYMHQDIESYQHIHDRVDTREINYINEEKKIDRDRHFGMDENNFNGEEINTEEKYSFREEINLERGQRYFDRAKSPEDGACLDFKHRSRQETEYFQREWSPDYQNRNEYEERTKRSHSRDNRWGQKRPHLRPEDRDTLHDSRERLNRNKFPRVSKDRRHDATIDRHKGSADYHDRQHYYHGSSSYLNRERQNSRPSFDESPMARRRRL